METTKTGRCIVYETRLVKVWALRVREHATDADAAGNIAHNLIGRHDREHMAVLFLNAKNAVIGAQIVAIGTDNGLAATPAQILRGAIMAGANAIIVAHNHPSGEPTPSREDIAFTVNLKAACEVLGVVLVDHVIVTANPNRAHSFCNCYTAPWSSGG